MATKNATATQTITVEQMVTLMARLQQSGVTMEQLMNGTEKAAPATSAQAREGTFWQEKTGEDNKGKAWHSFQVCHEYKSRGEVQTAIDFKGGPAGWTRLFGLDADGDSLLMAALSFVDDHSDDFVSVMSTVDVFVRSYLAMRAERLGGNEDILGTSEAADAGGEEVMQDVTTPLETLLTSEEYAALCRGRIMPAAINTAIYADFLASGVPLDDFLASMSEYSADGDVCDYLGEASMPGEAGEYVKHPDDAPRGFYVKATKAWRKLAESPVVVAEEPQVAAEPANPVAITAGARKHYGALLAQLPIWTNASESEKESLIVDAYSMVQLGGAKWTDVRDGLKAYKTPAEYFADAA